MSVRSLVEYLEASARRFPERTAVVDSNGVSLTYAELDRQASAIGRFLLAAGVVRGDRVGVALPKTIRSLATLFGIMKAGAAYVPVDYTAPAERCRRILTDCQVRALVTDVSTLDVAPRPSEGGAPLAAIVATNASSSSKGDVPVTAYDDALAAVGEPPTGERHVDDLAYILYTSGSTGVPKGVMLTHRNATSFVDWCSQVFQPTEHDRFSSHAPFHFDLSVLDLYVAIKHGACVFLISEELGKAPKDLARFISAQRLTVWYSTPSILTLLLQFGGLTTLDVSNLRLVLFAGEVFPVKHLRELTRCWPAPTYYNLYGPTETNVCTFARIPTPVPEDRDAPHPIGHPCSHCDALVLDGNSREVPAGHEGLLYISGPSVFGGYWNRPEENAAAFLTRQGTRWYNTGDLVRFDPDGGFVYAGRRDRMVKRRGYRIELGEIERALYTHPRVREAAVVAVPDADSGIRIGAFLACHDGATPSIIELKAFCGTHLPAYMNPDRFLFHRTLPKTSTDKMDYQSLRQELLAPVPAGTST